MNGNISISVKLTLPAVAISLIAIVASAQNPTYQTPTVVHQDGLHNGQFYESGNSCNVGCNQFGTTWGRARFFSRTLPPGNLSQRFPYDAPRFYYYDRPYNAFQADRRFQQHASQLTRPYQPYSKQSFRSVYEQLEQQIIDSRFLGYAENGEVIDDQYLAESSDEQIARDKNFEFTDWRKHHRARARWEQEQLLAEQNLEQPMLESPLEFRDVGHSAGSGSKQ